ATSPSACEPGEIPSQLDAFGCPLAPIIQSRLSTRSRTAMSLTLRWICALSSLILGGALAAPACGAGKYAIAPLAVANYNGFTPASMTWLALNDAGIVSGNGQYDVGTDFHPRSGVLINGTITQLGTLG